MRCTGTLALALRASYSQDTLPVWDLVSSSLHVLPVVGVKKLLKQDMQWRADQVPYKWCALAVGGPHHLPLTMRFGSTDKVLANCKLKYYRIAECAWAGMPLHYINQSFSFHLPPPHWPTLHESVTHIEILLQSTGQT